MAHRTRGGPGQSTGGALSGAGPATATREPTRVNPNHRARTPRIPRLARGDTKREEGQVEGVAARDGDDAVQGARKDDCGRTRTRDPEAGDREAVRPAISLVSPRGGEEPSCGPAQRGREPGPSGRPAIAAKAASAHLASTWAAGSGGPGFGGRGASAWFIAHCGWMPAREYTAFLQTGQIGRVGSGTCQCF
jgi:hypothetical protein